MSAALAACSPPVETRGNLPDPVLLGEITPGVHTKEQVETTLGTPSSTGTFDRNTWYYISAKTQRIAFFAPDVVDQQVVQVDFDDAGVVREVRRYTIDDAKDVDTVDRETPTRGQEPGIVRGILASIGFLGRNPLGGPVTTTKRERR
ncbi:MAG: outer membrane protein assembly factor BamE [Alphaproteobacteria bacterium]